MAFHDPGRGVKADGPMTQPGPAKPRRVCATGQRAQEKKRHGRPYVCVWWPDEPEVPIAVMVDRLKI